MGKQAPAVARASNVFNPRTARSPTAGLLVQYRFEKAEVLTGSAGAAGCPEEKSGCQSAEASNKVGTAFSACLLYVHREQTGRCLSYELKCYTPLQSTSTVVLTCPPQIFSPTVSSPRIVNANGSTSSYGHAKAIMARNSPPSWRRDRNYATWYTCVPAASGARDGIQSARSRLALSRRACLSRDR